MSRADTASSILKRYAVASGGAGWITAPFFGMAAVTALHLAVIRELSALYGVEFSKNSARGTLQDVDMEKLHQAWRHAFGSQPATP